MSSAPYWGELPGPKVAVPTNPHHSSADANTTGTTTTTTTTTATADRQRSLDAAIQLQPKPKRISVQTTNTEAESTTSPFASPVSSTAPDQGLAPRPPSFPYSSSFNPQPHHQSQHQRHTSQDTSDSADRSGHRSSRSQTGHHDHHDHPDSSAVQEPVEPVEDADPPPAAPDVPRGPPISYRPPYSPYNSPLYYAYPPIPSNAPRTARRPDLSLATEPMDYDNPEQYYMTAAGAPPNSAQTQRNRSLGHTSPETSPRVRRPSVSVDDRAAVLASIRQPEAGAGTGVSTGASAGASAGAGVGSSTGVGAGAGTAPVGPQAGESEGLLRRASTNGSQADRRKKLDEVRSPLQKLELTLDSITKEEKRARVAAAEQAARDRQARRAGKGALSADQQVARSLPRAQHRPPTQTQPQPQPQQHASFRERSNSIGEGEPRPLLQPDVSPIEESYQPITAHRGPLTQNPPAAPPDSEKPTAQNHQSVPRSAASGNVTSSSGIPQRNLSFRERAARNDVQLPEAAGLSTTDSDSHRFPAEGMPQRRNSAKLKKPPPGDVWYNKRVEAERRYAAVQPVQGTVRGGDRGTYANVHHQPQGPGAHRQLQFADSAYGTPSGSYAVSSNQRRPSAGGYAAADFSRSVPPTTNGRSFDGVNDSQYHSFASSTGAGAAIAAGTTTAKKVTRFQDENDTGGERRFEPQHQHRISNMVYRAGNKMLPGQGRYLPPQYLDEWRKSTVGTLSGSLLDLADQSSPSSSHDKTWWEQDTKQRRRGSSTRVRRGEAFDGEYDEANGPTRFKPPLHLVCGPLLRYCGIRKERPPRSQRTSNSTVERELWRGSVMIVTRDSDSSYDIAPTLRLFLQPLELLPPPPNEVEGALSPEYVDPLVGHPKLGRNGETLYVRPVEEIDEAKDLSRDETDNGLFEKTKSHAGQFSSNGTAADPPGSFSSRLKRTELDGEKAGKFKDVRGFRLHAERGVTFWRFNIEVELRETQQRIAYRINRSPSTGFWVPAKGQAMHIMFYSCNGFSLSANPNEFSGPDPLWRDVLNNHQTQPFHVMIGGGDQIYNDAVKHETSLFQEWLAIKNSVAKSNAAFTREMQDELEDFYLNRYAMWFSQGLFSLANSQIPMVNMYDDHDIIDGFGSYPHHFMKSPVFSGLGNVAFKYYMLFQHQSVIGETEESEPSWILGTKPGPYIEELSRSLFMHLGANVALLAVDCRTERMQDEVLNEDTWRRIIDRCYMEIEKGKVNHLLVLLSVPIAYPRLVWLENILSSRLMDPIKALGKTGILGDFLNHFDGGVEVCDDLNDHWTAKYHKDERKVVIEDLQDLAADKSVRVTILSGDVHLAAVGQFYSNQKQGLAKHQDFRYMPNVISSAIANTPPPDLLADILNKRNKIHHFDHGTDEDMIPLFGHGVDGKARNNKRLLPHRNWCSIQSYTPGSTPPGSSSQSMYSVAPLDTPRSSNRNVLRGPSFRRGQYAGSDYSRPPVSSGVLRTLSRGRASADNVRADRQGTSVKRSFSLSRDFRPDNLFRRLSSRRVRQSDDGGINGSWGPESDEVLPPEQPATANTMARNGSTNGYGSNYVQSQGQPYGGGVPRAHASGPVPYGDDVSTDSSEEIIPEGPVTRRGGAARIRGGAGTAAEVAAYNYNEYEQGDENYFSVKRRPAAPQQHTAGSVPSVQTLQGPVEQPPTRPFYRTPTGLSTKQLRRAQDFEVNLEGGLDIRLSVEVSPKDPTGITVPYRLVVPRLWYTYKGEELETETAAESKQTQGGVKRWLSLGRKQSVDE